MRLIRFGPSGSERPGLLQSDGIVDLRSWFPDIPDINTTFFENNWLQRIKELQKPGQKMAVRLGPPISQPSKIICLGKNYRDHAMESGMDVPKAPLLFCKTPNSLNGPYDPIIMPTGSGQIDWEVELAVIIGRRCKALTPDTAMTAVAGVCVMNDVSGREAQFGDGQWFRGKSFDTFAPLGPALVTLDEIDDLYDLPLTTRVDGNIMQQDSTANMVFKIAETIAYISENITLMPGDIISSGTPAGVGIFMKPARVLAPGEEVACNIKGIGTIRNRIVGSEQEAQAFEPNIPTEADLFGRG